MHPTFKYLRLDNNNNDISMKGLAPCLLGYDFRDCEALKEDPAHDDLDVVMKD